MAKMTTVTRQKTKRKMKVTHKHRGKSNAYFHGFIPDIRLTCKCFTIITYLVFVVLN